MDVLVRENEGLEITHVIMFLFGALGVNKNVTTQFYLGSSEHVGFVKR